ncbi:MAG: pyrroline-5-carboxylate reductase [Candidatus Latescibacteria bacterium]|jgi:pyrroline-5-carboxylate reductase|nr:pyrroline-5-carboxylate reductase [Candidatus Latescibacterota bacterium]
MPKTEGRRVALIGGGNMGGAIAAGMVDADLVPAERVTVVDVSAEVRKRLEDELGVATTSDASEVVDAHDILILALKPQIWRGVAESFREMVGPSHLVLSIMGGVTTSAMEEVLGEGVPVVRAMPNILAQVRAGISAVCAGRWADDAHVDLVMETLGAVGDTVAVDEWQMDAVTGLSGSGPAYVYSMIDALADGGVKAGLPKSVALQLAAKTVFGAAKVVLELGEHPAALRDRVTSAGGTTIAGLHALEQGGFRAALMSAVEAAAQRSRELGG